MPLVVPHSEMIGVTAYCLSYCLRTHVQFPRLFLIHEHITLPATTISCISISPFLHPNKSLVEATRVASSYCPLPLAGAGIHILAPPGQPGCFCGIITSNESMVVVLELTGGCTGVDGWEA